MVMEKSPLFLSYFCLLPSIPPVFLCHPFYLSSLSSFDLLYPTNGASGFFKRDTNWFFIIYRLRLLYCRGKISLMFVDPCIKVQFIQKNPTRCNSVSKFIIPYLYEAQQVSGVTPPIIRSLKLHWQPMVFIRERLLGV